MNEEHKFIYRIVCEPKITNNDKLLDGNFVSNLVTNMATMRLRAIDDSIICNLREIGREKNIDLLIAIDESKVMKMVKDLERLEEIKEIAKRYNWDDITSEIFNVKTDKKYRDLFNSAIVDIQKDYRKARALEVIENKGIDVSAVIQIAKSGKSYITYNNHLEKYKGVGDLVNQHRKPLIKEEWNLLTEVLVWANMTKPN